MFDSLSIKITLEPLYILYQLQKNGYEGFLVGGAVRDTLLDSLENDLSKTLDGSKQIFTLRASDYDFTTSARPEQIQKVFPENFYENNFGTVGVTKEHLLEQMGRVIEYQKYASSDKGKTINLDTATRIHESLISDHTEEKSKSTTKEVYEITTYRSEGEYKDHRRPENVEWGDSLESDLSRRDFTINALAIKVNQEFLEKLDFNSEIAVIEVNRENYEIIDLHEGITDLENEIIRTVGNPDKRFNEDALRVLRAIRFSLQLNMHIDSETFESIIRNSHLVKHISWERIRDEFLKMLKSPYPKEAIHILDEAGLLEIIIPELLEGKGVMQGGHHVSDVWNHNLDALDSCPSNDPIVRLATLLHDVAKPHTLKMIDNKPTFYNHEVIGSRIAKDVAKRLRLSKADIERTFTLVRHHMFHYQPENSDASIRRFMRNVGLENVNDILAVREGDRLGSGARKTSWRLEEMKQRMIQQLHQPFSIKDLKINGDILIKELDLEPGKIIGEILNSLFEKVMENPDLNTKEKLLSEAKKYIK